MKKALTLTGLLLATTVSATAAQSENASGDITCSYVVDVVGPDMQFNAKARSITQIRHQQGNMYSVTQTIYALGYNETAYFSVPINRVDNMWQVQLDDDGDSIKLQYDRYNGVKAAVLMEDGNWVDLLNGHYQEDGNYLDFKGSCQFKPLS